MPVRSIPFRSLRRLLLRVVIAVLVFPTLMILVYRFIDPPITPLMAIRLFEGEPLDKQWVPLDRISRHLANAVIAAEDNRFCEHFGFDGEALWEQIQTWIGGDRPRGASTLTMQTAKNILLWPGRDLARKLIEAWMTPQIELMWSKPRILEVYLNIVEMGPGLYGAEAAAQTYFGTTARQISPLQASLIAATLPNPRELSPARPSSYVTARAQTIRRRTDQLGPLLDCARPAP